jgi:hypothetical protein
MIGQILMGFGGLCVGFGILSAFFAPRAFMPFAGVGILFFVAGFVVWERNRTGPYDLEEGEYFGENSDQEAGFDPDRKPLDSSESRRN